VHREPPKELVRVEPHRRVAAGPVNAVVFVVEGHAILVGDQAAVQDCDTMRVARQISQYVLWPTKRFVGVDDPVGRGPRGRRQTS